MKKYIILNLIVLFALPFYTKAATIKHFSNIYFSHQDTNKYLINIIAQKSKFQHQSFNTLLDALAIKPKSYLFLKGKRISDPSRGVILFFEDGVTNSNKLHNQINVSSLIISFDKEIPFNKVIALFSKTFGEWGQEEKDFYGDMLIKDIEKNREK